MAWSLALLKASGLSVSSGDKNLEPKLEKWAAREQHYKNVCRNDNGDAGRGRGVTTRAREKHSHHSTKAGEAVAKLPKQWRWTWLQVPNLRDGHSSMNVLWSVICMDDSRVGLPLRALQSCMILQSTWSKFSKSLPHNRVILNLWVSFQCILRTCDI